MESKFVLFDTLTAENVRITPKAGTIYLFTWNEEKCKDDWRADGYRWRQMGQWRKTKCSSGELFKVWFYVSNFRFILYIVLYDY